MRLLLLGAIIAGNSLACTSQKTYADSTRNCTDIMNELSYYWKLDSLSNNGFRFYTYRMFLKCKIDQIDKEMLLSKLGKPNVVQETNKGYEYRYYYFDIANMPKGYDAPRACWYISFNFGIDHKYVTEIETGDIER